MSKIYAFLQKKKMHENHIGIYMVMIAYVLSFFMLFIGSDTFYNISSKAAEENNNTDEAAKKFTSNTIYEPKVGEPLKQVIAVSLINPYDTEEKNESGQTMLTDDTNWLLGYAMNAQEYDSLMNQLDQSGIIRQLSKSSGKKDQKKSPVKEMGGSIHVTAEEVDMLERIVEAEASGEDMIGKILIVNVVLNRIKDDTFPDTVEGVICQKTDGEYQFSPLADKRFWSVKISNDTEKAVQRALDGENYSDGALYFMARKRARGSSARWFDKNLEWLFQHGGHEFYKNK